MNKKQICRILFLFAMCSMLIEGMLAQSVADIARQEREKKREREKKQQEQGKDQEEQDLERSAAEFARQQREKEQQEQESARSAKIYRHDNVPAKDELSGPTPSSSPSSLVLPDGLPTSSPASSSVYRRDSRLALVAMLYARAPLLVILGYGLSIVGGLWFLVMAFRTSILWGLGCLFIPIVSLVYLCSHWKEARGPFAAQALGTVAFVIAFRIAGYF